MTERELASYFDHTLLKATATKEAIKKLCDEALYYQFASVCVNPYWVKSCSEALKDSSVKVCTVIGFPLGANTTTIKKKETKRAVKEGAQEIDMVLNVGAMLDGDYESVLKDIKSVVKAASGRTVKVILETCYLTEEQIKKACTLSLEGGADFVKTSTGFGTGGATPQHVKLMKETVDTSAKVKASGGIRTLKDTLEMIENGADRIGASAGVNVLKEFKGETHEGNDTGY